MTAGSEMRPSDASSAGAAFDSALVVVCVISMWRNSGTSTVWVGSCGDLESSANRPGWAKSAE
jgi:hypothetical protein